MHGSNVKIIEKFVFEIRQTQHLKYQMNFL